MLPSTLLHAISELGGGRVVLVTGAGCSVELPTGLPVSSVASLEAHRRLRADGVLQEDCANPRDLSEVADAVFAKTGSQDALVQRLPRDRFRTARPNEGHLLAAALLRERAVACVLTLNFDLAFSAALVRVGATTDVAMVAGPEHHRDLGTVNLIYLHRNVDAAPDEWILRTVKLDAEWKGNWEEVIVRRVLSGPVTVFAGLGSSCAVLTESARRVRAAVPEGAVVLQVDPASFDESSFARALDIVREDYVQLGWVQFMRELADRLLAEHSAAIAGECLRLVNEETLSSESVDLLIERLRTLGLLRVGKLRANWLLEDAEYATHGPLQATWLADVLLCIALVERVTGLQAILNEDGVVELWRGQENVASIAVGHGKGSRSLSALEPRLEAKYSRSTRRVKPRFAIAVGASGGAVTPPVDIVGTAETTDIVAGDVPRLKVISCHDLRQDIGLADKLIT